LVAAVSVACFGGLVTGLILASRKRKEKAPEKWIKVGTISDLIVYPVKSVAGIYVHEGTATKLGLKGCDSIILRDRVFLVVDSNGAFMNQKKLPELTSLAAEIDGDSLVLKVVDDPNQRIAVYMPNVCLHPVVRPCRLYNDSIKETLDCGEEVAIWLSRVLKREGLRLYYHAADKSQRSMSKLHKKFPFFSPDDLGTFHDETSYLMMSEKSIDEINSKIAGSPLTHKSFRPTIVIKGASEAFAEDFWTYVRIGNDAGPIFKTAMPCARCRMTQMDPKTGEVRPDGEPLKSIKSIKRQIRDRIVTKLTEKDAILGAHMGIFDRANVKIKVGDPVYAALL